MKKFLWDGSYTVEAAFLIPMILGIMYAWMFQLFYLHDRVIMDGLLQDMAVQAQMDREAGREPEESVDRQAIQQYLWLARITLAEREQNAVRIQYRIEASASWNIPVMKPFLGGYFNTSLAKSINNVHPETLLRLQEGDGE